MALRSFSLQWKVHVSHKLEPRKRIEKSFVRELWQLKTENLDSEGESQGLKESFYLGKKTLVCAGCDVQLWDLIKQVVSWWNIWNLALGEELNNICAVSI